MFADGQPIALTARAFGMLLALVERAGELVTKDELLKQVWGKVVVEEGNLQVQVSAVRKIVGGDAIETVPGVGYRFTLAVTPGDLGVQSVAAARNDNLPLHLSGFLGRQRELADLNRLLDETRLLCMTGTAGMGKTRVALQLAATAGDRFADGVWLVELAALTDEHMIPYAIAASLGIAEEARRPMRATVVDRLKGRRLLLVLDNCEHLLRACAVLAREMLLACAQVTIVATSREPLHIAGEWAYLLGPMSTPGETTTSVDELRRFESIELFETRARNVHSTFVMTPANASAVAAICRRLDGIPLAIELAAARVRSLSVSAIADRLGDRFRLLTQGDRTALPRQQTLRATIDWSHDFLTAQEQVLFRRLSVFAGGFALDAAEHAGADDDVVDLLCNLVDKSLVVLDGERYRMLETVREYALERLVLSGEERATRDRHLDYYRILAGSAERALFGPEQRAWHARLDSERENVMQALAHGQVAQGGAEAGLMILGALRPWLCGSRLEATHRTCADALVSVGADSAARSQACGTAGTVCYFLGRYEEAQQWTEEALRIAERVGDAAAIMDAATLLGATSLADGRWEVACAYSIRALELATQARDTVRAAYASNSVGEAYAAAGRHDLAEMHHERALALFREIGNVGDTAMALLNLARTRIAHGATGEAATLLLEIRGLVAELKRAQWDNVTLSLCAAIAAVLGDTVLAGRFHGAADAHRLRTGFRIEPNDEAFVAPVIAGGRATAPEAFDAAESDGRQLDDAAAMREAKAWLMTLR